MKRLSIVFITLLFSQQSIAMEEGMSSLNAPRGKKMCIKRPQLVLNTCSAYVRLKEVSEDEAREYDTACTLGCGGCAYVTTGIGLAATMPAWLSPLAATGFIPKVGFWIPLLKVVAVPCVPAVITGMVAAGTTYAVLKWGCPPYEREDDNKN